MRTAQTFKTNQLTTYETGGFPAATLSHWSEASSRKQSECGRHGLSNILKLQATFLYSIYHQRAGKTNLFHMRGVRFHAGNTLCTFKSSLFFISSLYMNTYACIDSLSIWYQDLLYRSGFALPCMIDVQTCVAKSVLRD